MAGKSSEQEEKKDEKKPVLDYEAKTYSNIKTLVGAAVGLIIGVFAAGIYWNNLKTKIDTAYDTGIVHTGEIKNIDGKIIGLVQFKEDLKLWSGKGQTISNVSGPGGGSGNADSICPDGSYMIGVKSSSNTAPPACIGCLTGVQVVCRPLPVK